MNEIINYIWDNKEWLFSGIGVLIFTGISVIIKFIYSKTRNKKKNDTMVQINTNHSSGTQIGTQNNYYKKENKNDK